MRRAVLIIAAAVGTACGARTGLQTPADGGARASFDGSDLDDAPDGERPCIPVSHYVGTWNAHGVNTVLEASPPGWITGGEYSDVEAFTSNATGDLSSDLGRDCGEHVGAVLCDRVEFPPVVDCHSGLTEGVITLRAVRDSLEVDYDWTWSVAANGDADVYTARGHQHTVFTRP